ncbi:hypothetical protein EXIGLDRAFT_432053 [Exidia glandulosa HHB12029]|uniref:C2H2-type domain-containing protein n=1 Tax=Exidia glandulosa HHB12029 TaxID=1314781 RepID=A0A165KHC0_EXIGL|nr:hypothetical protein EXIGLDRAFT_432053 [Exidia glandulosa HHB12029]
MSFSTNNLNNGVPATPACYAPRPRKRNTKPKPQPKPYTKTHTLPTPSPSASSSTSPSPPPVERWNCGLPGCTKDFGRVHELVRHLDSAHHSILRHADDSVLLSAGIQTQNVAKLRQLMAKRNACAVCGASFSRSDALNRHMDEQGHRPVVDTTAFVLPSIVPPPYGYQWQLVPVSHLVPVHATAPQLVPAPIPTPQLVPMPMEPAPVDPLQSLLDEILALSPPPAPEPLLGDVHSFPPAFEPEQQFALFPLAELEAMERWTGQLRFGVDSFGAEYSPSNSAVDYVIGQGSGRNTWYLGRYSWSQKSLFRRDLCGGRVFGHSA